MAHGFLPFTFEVKFTASIIPSPPLQAQYVFIHDALEELIICGDTSILSHNLRVKIGNLGKIVWGKSISGFQDQFEVCIKYCSGLRLRVQWLPGKSLQSSTMHRMAQ